MILILALAWGILLIVARWKVFTKAGEAGWKSIIPMYADYVQWRIGWKKINMFWVALALMAVGYFDVSVGGAIAYDATGTLVATGNFTILSILGVLFMVAGGVMDLIATYKLFVSFGKGVGWFILNLLFPNIMLLVLGFGSAQYMGPQD